MTYLFWTLIALAGTMFAGVIWMSIWLWLASRFDKAVDEHAEPYED